MNFAARPMLRAALTQAALLACSTQIAPAVPPPGGVAPLLTPAGGFAIDGNLTANTPLNIGDWIQCPPPAPSGAGGSVLDKAGVPFNAITTVHIRDDYGNMGTDQVFVGGLKWFDNPNSWRWTSGKCSSKTDINNVLMHIAPDAQGHVWAAVAGDRLSTSGDSYIDFEFLQNTLSSAADGTFRSEGPDGGRTANDLLLSLAFIGGGKVADFFAWRWQPLAGGGFGYVDITGSLPTGRVFVALNDAATAVPYDAFAQTNYDRYAFVEGAVDLTALVGNLDPCMALSVKTIMVKTKASQSSTATIEDFVDPLQFSLKIGPVADAGADQTVCSEGALTAVALQGVAHAGIRPITSTTWTVVAGSATIDDPSSLSTTAHVAPAGATLRLIVSQDNGCSVSDDVVLTVTPLPAIAIDGPVTDLCPASLQTFTAPAGMTGYAWSLSGNAAIVGSTNQQTVSVLTGPNCASPFTLGLAVTANHCSSSMTKDLMVNDTTPPVLSLPQDLTLECPADTRTNATGVATAQDECGTPAVTYHDDVTPGCGGTMILARTWTATDACGNVASAVQTILVRDRTPPSLSIPGDLTLDCPADTRPAATGTATAQDSCGSASVGYTDSINQRCGSTMILARTWTATDDCGNSTSRVQVITVQDRTAPAMVIPADRILECPADVSTNANGTARATDSCGAATVRYTDATTNLCGGTKVVRRTWTATDDCGNTTNAVQTLTVRDTTPPSVTAPPSLTLDCPADTRTNHTGVAVTADGCGSVTLLYSDSISNLCGGTMILTRTWTATDACGNTASAVQTIHVQDHTPPSITAPTSVVLECPADTRTNATGVATAQDGCSQVTVTCRDAVTDQCAGTRTITRTWTATDDCGNAASAVQVITVRDTHPPVIIPPADLVLECPADTQPAATGTATAQDGCSQTVVSYRDTVGTPCGGARTITRTWTATDACGNAASATQKITVRDTQPPTLTLPPDRVLECPADTRPVATGTATAQDGCSQATVTFSDVVTNLCGGSKIVTRTWSAADACGNKVSGVQTIKVQDTRPPEIQCALICTFTQGGYGGGGTPADILVANYSTQFPNGIVLGNYHTASGNAAPNGLWWQGNASGLDAIRSLLSTGGGTGGPLTRDAINPNDDANGGELAHQALTVALNIRFNEAGIIGIGPNNFGSLVYTRANDALSGLTVRQILGVANQVLAGGPLPPGYSFGDLTSLLDNLNLSFHEYSVSAFATSYLSAPAIVVQCASSIPAPDPSHVSAHDDCSGQVTVSHLSDVITDQVCASRFVMVRTWEARDACGNASTCSFQIIVDDTTAPSFIGNTQLSVPAGQAWNFQAPAAADNCGTVTLSVLNTVTNMASDFVLVVTRTWEAADACGNTNDFQQTVTVGGSAATTNTTPVVGSTFDTGDEGWLVTSGTGDAAPIYLPSGGQAGGFLNAGTPPNTNGTGRFWNAPLKYRGNRIDFYGGVLTFACKVSAGVTNTSSDSVVLSGAGLTLTLALNHPTGTNWITCTVRLHESAGWKNQALNRPATQAEIISVLNALASLLIRVESGADGTPGSLDNVALCTPSTPISSGWVLESRHPATRSMQLMWPVLATDHRLEQSDSLLAPSWIIVPTTPGVTNGLNQINLPTGAGTRFFRLRKITP